MESTRSFTKLYMLTQDCALRLEFFNGSGRYSTSFPAATNADLSYGISSVICRRLGSYLPRKILHVSA